MTREDFDIDVKKSSTKEGLISAMGKYIMSLEKRIAELEQPKSCDGCMYDSDRRFGCYRFNDCIRENTRQERTDRYEPKDKE